LFSGPAAAGWGGINIPTPPLPRIPTPPPIRIPTPPPPKIPTPTDVREDIGKTLSETATVASDIANTSLDTQASIPSQILGDELSGIVEVVNIPNRQVVSFSTSAVKGIAYVIETGDLELIAGLIANPVLASSSVLLAAELQRSRDTHYPSSKPVPTAIKSALRQSFPNSVLERARYTIGTVQPTLQNFVNKTQKGKHANHAIVADDVIVFSSDPGLNDLDFWAHEIRHVAQYQEWSVLGFAKRYLEDHKAVEADADSYGEKAKN
jgi:hypothetical protein